MSLDQKKILTAFQPAKEISDPKRFAGRKDELEAGAELLIAKNHIFIYGPRGIGKSSLAKQLEIIAKGNRELLEEIESPLKDMHFEFATCFLTRDESVNNVNQLLYRLMLDQAGFGKFQSLFEKFGEVDSRYELKGQLNARLVSDFWKRASAIASQYEDGLVIFLDEFELIENHEGFSSLLKAAPEGIVFAITGIATTELELVRDHRSIERQLTTGKLPVKPMAPNELLKVVATAENLIEHEIVYEEAAKTELIRLVAGQPYLLHLIGRESLLQAFREKRKTIGFDDLHKALSEIAVKKTDSTLEDRYLKAIGNSPQREIVLRAFAGVCNPNTHTSQAYPIAEAQGVTNASYCVADLQREGFGEILKKVKDQIYSFKDPLFQAYVAATPQRLSRERNGEEIKSTATVGQEFEMLHFSDMHFGKTHYFSALPSAQDTIPHADKPSLEKFINKAAARDNLTPDLIVISGDTTQNGTSKEFKEARQAIGTIRDGLTRNARSPDLILIPGNHDVNWALQDGDPESGIGFQPYINFRNELLTHGRIDVPINPERLYEVRLFHSGGLKIVIAAFNSAVLINKTDSRGYIGDSQLNNAIVEVNAADPDFQAVRIAVFHHHLVPVPSIESKIDAEALLVDAPVVKQKLYGAKFSLALHGHRHQGHEEIVSDGENSLVVIGCGSSAVVNPERGSQPLQFNKISIQLLKETTAVRVVKYFFDAQKSEWSPQTPRIFSIPRPNL